QRHGVGPVEREATEDTEAGLQPVVVVRALRGRAHRLQDLAHRSAHGRGDELVLVLEVEIDRALGDAGPVGDVLDPQRGPSLLRCERRRLSKDGVRSLSAHAVLKTLVHSVTPDPFYTNDLPGSL